jgi:arylsulfatase A-like enzyme
VKRALVAVLLVIAGATAAYLIARHSSSRAATTTTTTSGTSPTSTPSTSTTPAARKLPKHPNIVFILSDDQRTNTMNVMPKVQQLLVDHGIDFTNAVVSNSLCCPSRSTILTGNYSHTTHVYLNHGADGGAAGFLKFHDDQSTLATWLQHAGYATGLFGKYLNGYHAPYVPPGWTTFNAFNYANVYYGGQVAENGVVHIMPKTAYSTRYFGSMVTRFIKRQPRSKPFFVYYAPYTPHQPAIPETKYAHMKFPGLAKELFGDPAYYPKDVSDAPRYVRHAPARSPKNDAAAYKFALHQLQSLQTLDDEVAKIVGVLKSTGRLQNTIIIYASDNAVMWGEHRMLPASKSVPYEGAVHIPLVIRWDATGRHGLVDRELVANVDFAATMAALAHVSPAYRTEGHSFASLITGQGKPWVQRDVLLEHQYDNGEWTIGRAPGFCGVRTPDHMFAHYSGGFEELYDLRSDPYEMHNLIHSQPALAAQLRAETKRLCKPYPPQFRW